MSGWAWFLVVMLTISGLTTVGFVGRPREPVSPMVAIVNLIMCGVAIYAVLKVAGVA